jgi:hypothetical protein
MEKRRLANEFLHGADIVNGNAAIHEVDGILNRASHGGWIASGADGNRK